LTAAEELERHIRLLVEQNKLIVREIDEFISADALIARCLNDRHSPAKIKLQDLN
jgi:hypothetical protein